MLVVEAREAEERVGRVLVAEGVPADEAELQAWFLIEAELRGHPSHGLQRLRIIVERLRKGLIAPGQQKSVTWNGGSAARVDGRKGLGPVVGMYVMDEVATRARETGVAVAAVHNANHLGMLAPYVERAAEAGLIGVSMATSEALVHPLGGVRAILGTNPIAVAVPTEPEPFVLDIATGAVSMGRILAHASSGQPLSPGWAVDADGNPTLDPVEAAKGAISPAGGVIGYALGLAVEMVVAVLSGSALGTEVTGTLDSESVCNKGEIFMCCDPARFAGPLDQDSLARFLRELRDSRAPGSAEPVRIPGDRARAGRDRRTRDGIEVLDEAWKAVISLDPERA